MTDRSTHRLAGLEPDNLLAFLALLGILRTLEHAHPELCARISWTIDEPPVRPELHVAALTTESEIVVAVTRGLNDLAQRHDFNGLRNLRLSQQKAAERLRAAAISDRYTSDLWAALVSDAVVRDRTKLQEVEPTPLCIQHGQGHQHFMSRLASVPKESPGKATGIDGKPVIIQETDSLHDTIFKPWIRRDLNSSSFRWDPQDDVRYALRATDPTDRKTKAGTQHGANRLAAVGLSVLTVVPRMRAGKVRLNVVGGGEHCRRFAFTWPIWRDPVSLAGIQSLLGHTGLHNAGTREVLGIVELRRTRQIQVDKYKNFTIAEPLF